LAQSQQQRPAATLDAIAILVRRNRGEEIHGAASPGEYWYRIVSGAAKCSVVLPGGRRQILDLLRPNDFFGFTPPGGHCCTLEALVNNTVVACYPRRRAEELADASPEVAGEVRRLAFDGVARLQELLLIMGNTTARKKVASFLLKTKERSSRQADDRVVLFTSRYDIADYLALSVETVSRSLTDLKQRGFIALSGPRGVRIVNPHCLDDDDLDRSSETPHPLARAEHFGAATTKLRQT
jgi:CRP-like cAMP-binding protein